MRSLRGGKIVKDDAPRSPRRFRGEGAMTSCANHDPERDSGFQAVRMRWFTKGAIGSPPSMIWR
jgi:hypothetical protein